MLDRPFEQIQVLQDEAAGCIAFIAIHSTRLGPAFGGIRRWEYATTEAAIADALDLAQAMTWKCAIAGVPGGGGKTVIVQRAGMDRAAAYEMVGEFVDQMGGRYYTGPDVGTSAADLEGVAMHTDFVARPGVDGAGDLAIPTALGVFAGIQATSRRLGFSSLDGVHVAIQGLGGVGWRVARLLREAGARLTVADLDPDVTERARAEFDAEVADTAGLPRIACDVFAPCALGSVIDLETARRTEARAIAGSANNILVDARCGEELFGRGVLVAPDFVINGGALVHGALFHLDGQAPPRERVLAIGDLVGELLDRAAADRRPPEVLALEMARQRVEEAPPGRFMPRRSQ